MKDETRPTMRAVAMDRFGGPEVLKPRNLPVPGVGSGEVLVRVQVAGVGEWDPFEREGGYAEMLGIEPEFPYVLGSEGAGVVVAVGERVGRFKEGDRVYACGFLNPKGGFYAEYAAVDASYVSYVPARLMITQAGAMSGVATTALRGLDDVLVLKQGESVMIFGASGGVGHVAVQLAKRLGTRVLAVASGDDGVALVERLGADATANGRTDDVLAAIRRFAPAGLDAALLTAGGEAVEKALRGVHDGGRVAFPKGIEPEPKPRSGLRFSGYYGAADSEIIGRLDRLIGAGPFEVHVAQTFPLDRAADAHRALDDHYLEKARPASGLRTAAPRRRDARRAACPPVTVRFVVLPGRPSTTTVGSRPPGRRPHVQKLTPADDAAAGPLRPRGRHQ